MVYMLAGLITDACELGHLGIYPPYSDLSRLYRAARGARRPLVGPSGPFTPSFVFFFVLSSSCVMPFFFIWFAYIVFFFSSFLSSSSSRLVSAISCEVSPANPPQWEQNLSLGQRELHVGRDCPGPHGGGLHPRRGGHLPRRGESF